MVVCFFFLYDFLVRFLIVEMYKLRLNVGILFCVVVVLGIVLSCGLDWRFF